jgi:hypothetical protein
MSERLCTAFLIRYINKVLLDSGIKDSFDSFLLKQTKSAYDEVKNTFEVFTKTYTPIKGSLECGRIFTKIINPLAYSLSMCGSERGKLSKDVVSYTMLMYNRDNFRDEYTNKPKGISRNLFTPENLQKNKKLEYDMVRAIKTVKYFNDLYNKGKSEINKFDDEKASETHHIFPRSEFPEISHYMENLINLTPNEHRNHAHPLGDYMRINKEFQKICLIAKVGTIKFSVLNNTGFYEFSNLLIVLTDGLNSLNFRSIINNDFESVIDEINRCY